MGVLGLLIGGGVVGGVMAATDHDTRPGVSRLRDGGGHHQFRGGQGFGGQSPNGQGFGGQGPNGQGPNGQGPNGQGPNGQGSSGQNGTSGTGDSSGTGDGI
ncbi:hypothetical protein [Amycolatopsis sp. PS_44_ISF1]|uniref:hypothetical protein n=1 Tax=Amycolatopsis sp. PS_44_ISF1 TaxID=2974917 RepID=UPI0028DEF827|nr:hypothetical protein [Amycolatopsis sp. PS_44_ISF1]MDT8910267.1 hypothetical protein [Amycolatopsis sp. PS_44_ISF1]